MDRQNRLGARCNGGRDPAWVDVEGIGVDIHQNRRRARVSDGGNRGDKGERRGNHFIAGTDAGGQKRQVQRAGAGVRPNAECGATTGGELLFERGDFATEDEGGIVQHLVNGRVDLFADGAVLGLQIDERDQLLWYRRRPCQHRTFRSSDSA